MSSATMNSGAMNILKTNDTAIVLRLTGLAKRQGMLT